MSALTILFFLLDASGKLLQIEPVMKGTVELGWPSSAVIPLGLLLLVGAVLHAVPRTSALGAIYLTGFLGGAIASHYRIGSPLFTHVLFGVCVATIMWSGLLLRYPALRAVVLSLHGSRNWRIWRLLGRVDEALVIRHRRGGREAGRRD